jgi:hypothetical protein
MGRLTEYFGRLAGNQPHGHLTHLDVRATAGGSRPKTRPGPLEAAYASDAVPTLVRAGGYDVEPGVARRLQRAGTLAQIIVKMRTAYDASDRTAFDALIARHDSLFADLDDKPGDISAMGAEVRSICFPR